MKKTLVWILIAANVSLAGTLAWRGLASNTANAQTTARGKYIMIPGENAGSSEIIYLFDAANGRLGAMAPDSKNVLVSMPPIDIKPVFQAALNGQTPAATGANRGANGNSSNNNNPNTGPNARPGGQRRGQ